MDNKKTANILLVEDNPADQQLTIRAFKKGRLTVDLTIVNDGQEALDILNSEGDYASATVSYIPDLILLDINMPRMGGKATLKEIRSNPITSLIPVIMLTTSDHETDILESYQLGVNAYIRKPIEIMDFIAVIHKLEEFWFTLTLLPPKL